MTVNEVSVRGWVFYDAECRFCVAGRTRWGPLLERRGFVWVPLQTPGAAGRLGVTEERLFAEMWLKLADGRVVSGVNSWSILMRAVWWLWPLGMLLEVPGINPIAAWVYRWTARNRHCLGGACKIHSHGPAPFHLSDLVVLALALGLVGALGRAWPAWVYMWALAFVLGWFAKWFAWRDARGARRQMPIGLTLAWFLLWPGLDARAFFERAHANKGKLREWFAAILKLAIGATLLWVIAPRCFTDNPLACGWVGLIGLGLGLHFGLFHVMSLAWRAAGVNAAHIMNRPLAVRSLAEFWGERWNTGFSIPSRRFLFKPIARRFGTGVAFGVVFLVSGLMHDLVISVPARGGYGLPTAYFLLQGAGVLIERSRFGRVLGLGRGLRGWSFMFAFTAGPMFWLFHPPFVHNVILPMLHALGAT